MPDAQWILWMGAIGGFVAAFYSRLRGFVDYFSTYALVRIRVEGEASRALSYYLWRTAKASRFGERRYDGFASFIRPLDRWGAVAYETTGFSSRIFWIGWRPLLVRRQTPSHNEPQVPTSTTVTYLRGTFDHDALVVAALHAYNGRNQDAAGDSRFRVIDVGRGGGDGMDQSDGPRAMSSSPPLSQYNPAGADASDRLVGYALSDLGQTPPGLPFASYAATEEIEQARERASRWMKSKSLYRDRGVPWRYGLLLHGKPGTGKSSFIREMARDLNVPVYRFHLSEMSGPTFRRHWTEAQENAPCIVAFEDIDATFDGRENKAAESTQARHLLTFDTLLNTISGIDPADGVLLVVTTNHLDKVDDAMKRAGRLDIHVEFRQLDEPGRRQIASRILSGYPTLAEEAITSGSGETGAEFTERCQSIFLKEYWN